MNIEELIRAIESLPKDLRMEVLMGELVENQLSDLERVAIKALGIFNRGLGRDLGEIAVEKDDFGTVQRIVFPVHREGIYDALPKGLFHYPRNKKIQKERKGDRRRSSVTGKRRGGSEKFFLPDRARIFSGKGFC